MTNAAPSTTVLSFFTPALLRHLGGQRCDVDTLCRTVGLDASAARADFIKLPVRVHQRLASCAEEIAGDPSIGLTVAARRTRGSYGLLEFAARSAPTVGAALDVIVRYQRLVTDTKELALLAHGPSASIRHSAEPGERHADEFGVATLLLFLRSALDRPLTPNRVWFAHRRPRSIEPLVELFETKEISFGARSNGFEMDREVLAWPLVTADVALNTLLRRYASKELPNAGDDLTRALHRVLVQLLPDGGPSAAKSARAMGMATRTLQRRLAEVGTQFHAEVERTRGELAATYLRDRRRSVGEVAALLGYGDPRSFLRAFRRWTGKSPSEFRAASLD